MINKYETIGIFASVGLMALALFLLRVESTTIDKVDQAPEEQSAIALVADGKDKNKALFETLATSVSDEGNVEKLIIDDVVIGSGDAVETGNTVSVNYIGTLQNGQEFDNSYKRGAPITVEVGAGKVIEGWDLGLVGLKVGGQRILVIPPDMAYGNQEVGPIPANSTLIFAVELMKIK